MRNQGIESLFSNAKCCSLSVFSTAATCNLAIETSKSKLVNQLLFLKPIAVVTECHIRSNERRHRQRKSPPPHPLPPYQVHQPTKRIQQIIICGAGPSGLILGLLLAKAGIRVQILDAASSVNTNPRASHYGPPAVYELQRAGVIEEVAAQGFRPDGVSWRRLDGSCITKIDTKDVPVEKKIVCLPLDQLMKILLRHIEAQPSAEVLWSHKVVGLSDGEERATVDVETPEGTKTLEATYVVGCDGATSTIRRQLFGDAFPGRTWDEQIVATNVGGHIRSSSGIDSIS